MFLSYTSNEASYSLSSKFRKYPRSTWSAYCGATLLLLGTHRSLGFDTVALDSRCRYWRGARIGGLQGARPVQRVRGCKTRLKARVRLDESSSTIGGGIQDISECVIAHDMCRPD